jgi:hypothetical protein
MKERIINRFIEVDNSIFTGDIELSKI